MNTKKEDPGKMAGAPGGPGSNRPHATLDLKATEIESKSAKEKTASSPSGVTKAGESPAGGRVDPVSAKEQGPTKAELPKPQPTAGYGAARVSPGAGPREAPSATKAQPTQKPQSKPAKRYFELGSLITHFAAGVAGGIIALLAIDLLAPQLGLTGAANDLKQR